MRVRAGSTKVWNLIYLEREERRYDGLGLLGYTLSIPWGGSFLHYQKARKAWLARGGKAIKSEPSR